MQLPANPALADVADVLSGQLKTHLEALSAEVVGVADRLEARFRRRLRELGFVPAALDPLVQLVFGSAARQISAGEPVRHFFEGATAAGKRLARLNVVPADVTQAIAEYDAILDEYLSSRRPDAKADAQWVREQMHFCVIISLNNAYYQVRESEARAFQDVLSIELESQDAEEVYGRFLEAIAAIFHARAALLFLPSADESELIPAAAYGGVGRLASVPQRLTTALRRRLTAPSNGARPRPPLSSGLEKRFPRLWSVPIVRHGELAAVLQLGFTEEVDCLPRDLDLMRAAAERCLAAAERTRLMADLAARERTLTQLAEHMLQVEEMERRRISRELHDDAGQSLVCIRLQLELTEGDVPAELTSVRERLAEIRDLTEKTILDIRRLISDLSPAVLEQLGIGAAVRQLVNRFRKAYPCSVRLHVGRVTDVPQKVQTVTYRLLQECCQNIARHSSATDVNISLTSADGVLRLHVRDNGVGFVVQEALAKHKSFGLAGMRERVALLGGRFEIRSEPRKKRGRRTGTEIYIELPLPTQENTST